MINNLTKRFSGILPYIQIQEYARDGGHANPRHRIELRGAPSKIVAKALKFAAPCVTCGASILPFRARANKNLRSTDHGIYLAVACPLDVSVRCSRTKKAAMAYEQIVAALGVKPASM